MNESCGGCDVFVNLALSQIIEYCGSQRRLARVKESSQSLLEAITSKKYQRHTVEVVVAYVEPLKLACDSGEARLAELALDCLQKLMAYKFIRNDMYLPPRKGADGTMRVQSVLGIVVNTVGTCIKIPNEPLVQLQIIRCALTAVTDCEAHDSALQSLVSVVFNLMIHSRDPVNQMTARAHLTQMINFIFNRLETAATKPPPLPIHNRTGSANMDASTENLSDGVAITPRSIATNPSHSPVDAPVEPVSSPLIPPVTPVTPLDSEHSALADVTTTTSTTSPDPTNSEILSTHVSPVPEAKPEPIRTKSPKSTLPPEVRDTIVLFNFLSKASNVDVTEATPPDSPQVRKCLRALEWLHKILQSSGPTFRSNMHILHGIREPLCHALLKTCMSPVPAVFKLSLDIVVTLICYFKRYLKNEIGLLVKNVFLWLLESPNAQFLQKLTVLQALQQVCRRSQVVLDIFLNFDCDVHSPNILEDIVTSISKMVQTEHLETNWISLKEATTLRELSLQLLVLLLFSLIKWINRFSPNPPADDDSGCEGEYCDQETALAGTGKPLSEHLERQRTLKLQIQLGVAEFNKKPKKGIKFWMDHNLISEDPKEVGVFLRTTAGIDKQVLGDYLGGEEEFNRKVLLAYVETIDFIGLSIDDALRKFLSVFALPGEGQKIERILEQFSEVFLRSDSSNSFEAPDAVYILAVAIVMLNTDLHNPQVRDKMSKAQFLSQLKGINNGKDLPTAYLEGIYDRIESRPFTNDESGAVQSAAAAETLAVLGSTGSSLFLSKKERKQMQYTVESRSMLKQTKDMMDQRTQTSERYYAANDITYVRPIFSVVWAPIHAAFSTSLETAVEQNIINLCLEGFEHGIHIAALFEMPTEREAFISALSKMTYINNLRQINQKNIDSIHTLINIAHREGDLLQNSWLEIIRTISQLERLQVVGRAASGGTVDATKPIDEQNAVTIANKIDDVSINKIFANSVYLSQQGLVNFVQCLCQVCTEELLVNTPPRMYCLQKVVEVATENLGQRIICIWSCIAATYAEIGWKGKPQIASMAIDSLRQLVMKCLDQPELIECQLQPEFLDPFFRIMSNTSAAQETRDHVLRCIEQIVKTKASLLQGGWSSVFRALEVAANDRHPDIIALGWQLLKSILADSFAYNAEHLVLSKAIHALYSFSASEGAVSTEALKQFPQVAAEVRNTCTASPHLINAGHAQALWLSSLHDIALLCFHGKAATRQVAVGILKEVIDAHGDAFAGSTWPTVFKSILFDIITKPLFPDYQSQHPIFVSRAQWMTTTAPSCFQLLGHTYIKFVAVEAVRALLADVMQLHVRVAKQSDKELIRLAMGSYCHIFQALAGQWTSEEWTVFTESIRAIIHASTIRSTCLLPYMSNTKDIAQVRLPPPPSPSSRREHEEESFQSQAHLVAHLLTHAHRQQAVVVFLEGMLPTWLPVMGTDNVMAILDSLYVFYTSACFFQSQALASWRLAIWLGGTAEVELLEAILQMQSETIMLYFRVAFQLHASQPQNETVLQELLEHCKEVLQHFVSVDDSPEDKAAETHHGETHLPHHLTEAHGLAPVIATIIGSLCQWRQEDFLAHVTPMHDTFLSLILCDNFAVRVEVKRYFTLWVSSLR